MIYGAVLPFSGERRKLSGSKRILLDCSTHNFYRLGDRRPSPVNRAGLNSTQGVLSFNQAAENGVDAVQRRQGGIRNIELRCVRVGLRALVCHRQRSSLRMRCHSEPLVVEKSFGKNAMALLACPRWIPTLEQKPRDAAMEHRIVQVAGCCKGKEVKASPWALAAEERELEIAKGCVQDYRHPANFFFFFWVVTTHPSALYFPATIEIWRSYHDQ
jgi:hypothetical protein